jgi:hypothetical protein
MKHSPLILLFALLMISAISVSADILYTTDNEVYEGEFVAFRFETIYFNVYQFGKVSETKRFPLFKIHKIVFNPKQEGVEGSFELEQKYKKLRRGKRATRVILTSGTDWKDTGILVKEGQNILFSITGSILIEKDHKVLNYGELNVKWDRRKQLPTQPTGAVIARIGDDGIPFYVGDNKAPFQCKKTGKLFIGINDYNFKDNEGEFAVTIYY